MYLKVLLYFARARSKVKVCFDFHILWCSAVFAQLLENTAYLGFAQLLENTAYLGK